MATLINNGLSPSQPVTMAVAPDGVLYVTNGIDGARRWDGQTASAETAGITASTAHCEVAGSGSGDIYGSFDVYTRFVDDAGVPSSFSAATTIAVTSGDSFGQFDYTSIPISDEDRVVGRQIWRSTAGQSTTFYLDVEIDNNSDQSDSSTRTDGELVQQTAMRYLTEDGWPNANRFGPPPSHMQVVVSFGNRMWYLVPADYTEGSASVSGTTVSGSGVQWTRQMIGRRVYRGGKLSGVISGFTNNGLLALSTSAVSGFGSGSYYRIGDDDERNKVYFSEAGEPESFPLDDDGAHTNVITGQEDGDKLTGGMPLGSYLYLLKESHIYRLSTAGDPRRDAGIALVAERGCLNQRCWCRVEGMAFLMDRAGVYVFRGTQTEAVSPPVQDFFRGRINWSRSKWFHA
ncbi:MAG TPA: hypothetical protein ENH80_08790, partial [Phycisphaerae bacterium]|nr:hypothetical protein [Phycisphaerae bacterium]